MALGLGLLLLAAPLQAQDLNSAEIVVTANRVEQDSYSRDMPAVGLRRPADYLVQQVVIRGDTRDPKERRREIYEMLGKAVGMATKSGIELAYGDYILTPLTAENVTDLALKNDNRPDSQRVDFLVKVRLSGVTGQQAEAKIAKFIDAVPEVGRAQMDAFDDSTLSVVGPDSYRQKIAAVIAEDARMLAQTVGEGYAVEIEGLNMPVQWTRAGASDVLLYIPYKLTVVPKR
ncbi:MAG: TonB-dependent receptor [Sphingomonas sp.]|nr:TonB-dependent receptor [Sphingomonas sp.]